MLWINFLHLYQPAAADKEIIAAAIAKSYHRLVKALLKNPRVKFTLNVSGCLLEKIDELGCHALLAGIKKLLARGQIELTGTAAYHPILPLIPADEAKAQIKLQEKLLKKYFGKIKTRGFFLPEMAYSPAIAALIKNLGYEWIILDEMSNGHRLKKLDCGRIYADANSGLKIIFRERRLSQSYVPKTIQRLLDENSGQIAVTATDAELYGLNYNDLSGRLEKLIQRPDLQTETVSAFIKKQASPESIAPVASSWESTPAELRRGQPFALWQNKRNKIQLKIWELARLAWETAERYDNDCQRLWVERHLRRGLASCTFWWASGHNFKNLFGALSWSPDEIERGVNELTKAVRSIDDSASRAAKIKAEKLCLEIKKLIWNKHWKYYWKK
ncbi:hypothetical protein COU00_02640 [Candidatus Falkowbacteria bacterium CG10_big_fil_rev_8_21_14_0_10_43_11]|uniref:Glycoside hydrolase family 57 N-terminal domain-containing protein n=1 Tax=Candidatus Falkowbacteria bacterium CG10_big_fil_rev_8_21_14_0_10_43_11 TaxID=1974568 RepID=A0A2M6WLU9_9BACT|nr:MAG: hypothetical protein COU00_02640 [Candidatus Falkowbacteria bacterium CG10_big_fil_rev_8_21_14_0_10_43_11]